MLAISHIIEAYYVTRLYVPGLRYILPDTHVRQLLSHWSFMQLKLFTVQADTPTTFSVQPNTTSSRVRRLPSKEIGQRGWTRL